MTAARARAEAQSQRYKLTRSYNELLEAFSSKDLQTVGNYELGRLIGKGSFGKVYLATHKLTNGSKVVLKSANKDDSNLAREIHHHRQFLHPHIARLYEVIVTEKLVWLVLEYCPGDELYNYLHHHGPLPVEKVQKIFTQLVGAVTYVHNKSCVHRDLKLENILLDKHENVKLCDFGFTREYEGKASYLQTSCGTICYAAPEMLKGEKYAGEKVDVWSLGVILYALLTGELPFDEDDDNATKTKILSCEPKYPDHLPSDAKALISLLLSKRPLLRPSLSDILANPFLSEHAPQQQAILKLQQPAQFSTKLEKDTLERMHSAGVDIDKVIENVLAQRCDALAGWWALLIEKEERKEARRERKRRQKEAEARSLRRLSAASMRLERMAPTIREIDEQGGQTAIVGDPPRSRGRREVRNGSGGAFELPQLPEITTFDSSESGVPPPPIDKDSIRSVSTSRQRPPLPPKEPSRRTRTSAMQLVASGNQDLLSPTTIRKRRRSRWHYYPIMNQLNQVKDWLAKRAKSPGSKSIPSAGNSPNGQNKIGPKIVETVLDEQASSSSTAKLALQPVNSKTSSSNLPPGRISTSSRRRSSLSPAPITPHSSFIRRPSTGLRGRKSTSSSVSSVRSIRHRHSHSHSKASSASSNSLNSPTTKTARSPRNSIKVLPATPTAVSFPSNIRVVRGSPTTHHNYNEPASFGLSSPGLAFAKRKRRGPMKGPLLSIGTGGVGGIGGGGGPSTRRDHSTSRSASAAGRHSGEIIEEEDEDEEEDEVEEVDAFSPVVGPGEIEVTIDGPGSTEE
ncbi:MAG: hypothetical protein M1823_003481 [Watsoniomyces obsoletus]|nr:MAG: hypothetical protein M1823_003481 [Watsoniomyces obsoletus]